AKEPQTVDKLRQVFMQDLSTRVKKVHGLPFFLCGLSVVVVVGGQPLRFGVFACQPSRSLQDIICHCRPPSAAASEPESLTKRTPTTKLPSTTEARRPALLGSKKMKTVKAQMNRDVLFFREGGGADGGVGMCEPGGDFGLGPLVGTVCVVVEGFPSLGVDVPLLDRQGVVALSKLSRLGNLWQGFLGHAEWTAEPDRLTCFKHLRSLQMDLSWSAGIPNVNETNYITGWVRLWPATCRRSTELEFAKRTRNSRSKASTAWPVTTVMRFLSSLEDIQ
ncbi:hypothetical protein INR49_003204, partial [Caranx melampygus]